ncbi:MAG: hypothetical protein JJ971_12385 [Balneolaceae bacterium]|nr:hypothetical protein [Balneolaceae bacterium]MBO6547350.1 hypothetical protein [Balneolaceae bacterium]MBO6647703.1 hypothetical protein [Balneolaceae bacterium]
MKKSFIYSAKTALTLLLVAGLFISCDNSTGSEDDHSEPEGFRLKMNGQTVVEQLPDQTLTGEFELAPGEETALITIFFIDHDGDEFQPDEPEYSLGAEFETDGIAEFEQHEEDGKWSFHIHAEAEGITDMTLMLMHNGHSDFNSQDIHVHVEAEESQP